MKIVNVHDAKTHFSKLLASAVAGEEIIIAKAGKPYVRLVPVAIKTRKPGAAKGKGKLTAAFFEPLNEDELKQWQ
jgi:prevent-host-death family protein